MIVIETDLNKIKKLLLENEDENWKFISFLKTCDIPSEKIDSIVHRLYKNISSGIDCKTCANCCKEMRPVLNIEDIQKHSIGLHLSVSQFKIKYLTKDGDSENYIFNTKHCPFLKANLCSNYAFRPENCKSYPYLHNSDFSFRLINVIVNFSVCPIVFNVYESLKDEILNITTLALITPTPPESHLLGREMHPHPDEDIKTIQEGVQTKGLPIRTETLT